MGAVSLGVHTELTVDDDSEALVTICVPQLEVPSLHTYMLFPE